MKTISLKGKIFALFLASSLVIFYVALLTAQDVYAADLRCSLSASDTSIDEGEGVTLRWTSDDADEGRITPEVGDLDDDDVDSGSERVFPDEDTTYRAIFENDDDDVECSVRINVRGDNDDDTNDEEDEDSSGSLRCSLRVDDDDVEEGEYVRVRWTSDDADEGRISPRIEGLDDDDLESGSEDVRLTSDTTFVARFENDDDEVECRVEVIVDEDDNDNNNNNNNDNNNDNGNTGGLLYCTPAQQSAVGNQSVTFTASGGNGQYLWVGASGVLQNSSSRVLSTSLLQAGGPHVYLKSGNQQVLCSINALGGTGTPGFPNTGRGGGDAPLLPFVIGLTALGGMGIFLRYSWRLVRQY